MKLDLDTLTKLVDTTGKDTFYYNDVEHPEGGDKYRIFNYRLASFKDFLENPMFLWCRGTMFNLRTKRIASRPMEKFFNYHEWKLNETELPESNLWYAEPKHDGSLVSTYLHSDGQVYLKSKGSLESSQAIRATELFRERYINSQNDFYRNVLYSEIKDVTYNYEYVGIDNLIVVPYADEALMYLNAIENDTGIYAPFSFSANKVVEPEDLDHFAESVYADDDVLHEGYVMVSSCNKHRFKLKTHRYVAAHQLKDNVDSVKKLVKLVVSGKIDDVLTDIDVAADKSFREKLFNRAEFIKNTINHCVKLCEDFYNENKNDSRKDYAIKAQATDLPLAFLICLLDGKELPIEKHYLKHLHIFKEEFGV